MEEQKNNNNIDSSIFSCVGKTRKREEITTQTDASVQSSLPQPYVPPLKRPKVLFTRKSKKQRKKAPLKKDRFCLYCGRNQTPEWRKGPDGTLSYVYLSFFLFFKFPLLMLENSLCNACGLNYAKNLKKEKEIIPPKGREPTLSFILNPSNE